jgi:hypothetical protein
MLLLLLLLLLLVVVVVVSPDIVVKIIQGTIRWAGHVQRMPETRSVKKVFF